MTVEVFGLQDGSGENAEKTRRAICCMLARGASIGTVNGGLIAATDLQVTYQGAGLKLTIAEGEAIIPGNVNTSGQSGYYGRLTSSETRTLTAASSSNPRIERVSFVVKDASYTGSENLGEIVVSEGTATSGATLANLLGVATAPKNSVTLAYVLVPAGASTISNADIRNVAELCVPGLQAATYREGTAAERPAAGVKGRIYRATDTEIYSVDTGAAWHELQPLIAGSQVYSALASRTEGTEYEPSAVRATSVVASIAGTGTFAGAIVVGGVTMAEFGLNATGVASATFTVPAGKKWKWTKASGTIVVETSYLPL